MTGAHWLILAAAAVAAVLWLWWTRRRPRIRPYSIGEWRRTLDAIDAEQHRRAEWVDEHGDPTRAQIDHALAVVAEQCCDLHNRNCEPPSELCCWQCTEAEHPRHRTTECIAPDLSAVVVDQAKADHLNAAMRSLEHTVPWPHLTAEEAADCTRCSPSSPAPTHRRRG